MLRQKVAKVFLSLTLIASTLSSVQLATGCTNILVTRGASSDGSVFVSFAVDGAGVGNLYLTKGQPKGDPDAKDPVVAEWTGPTYNVLGWMNEHQVAIGETTTGGLPQLNNTEVGLEYPRLMQLALARCKTAPEAIDEIARLVDKFGYAGGGETLSIGDKNEVWMMEIVGKGPDRKGGIWVAARVPDGYMTVHANLSRITTFPLDDPANWRYSPDVIDFAVEKGLYDPKAGKPFSFRDVYHANINHFSRKVCAGRVWSAYRRAAPSQTFAVSYFRDAEATEDLPLFIKPDKKLSAHDVMQLYRDHFEGTPYDMTKGIAAGPFGSPYRWRGLTWKVDDKDYCWERPLSSQQAAYVWLAEMRNWLPDPIGGVYWFTPDDCFTSCFAPFYCGITRLPECYEKGSLDEFSWDSAWWVQNLVSNYTYMRYSRIIPDVQKVQKEEEAKFFKMQPLIEETALKLAESDDELMREFLTNYSVSSSEALFHRWQKLAKEIIVKHNDGWVKEPGKIPEGIGYPEEWLRRVVEERPKQYVVEGGVDH